MRLTLMLVFPPVSQVLVFPNEPASTVVIEFDTNNSIFGLPRQFVVASAGKQPGDDFTLDLSISIPSSRPHSHWIRRNFVLFLC